MCPLRHRCVFVMQMYNYELKQLAHITCKQPADYHHQDCILLSFNYHQHFSTFLALEHYRRNCRPFSNVTIGKAQVLIKNDGWISGSCWCADGREVSLDGFLSGSFTDGWLYQMLPKSIQQLSRHFTDSHKCPACDGTKRKVIRKPNQNSPSKEGEDLYPILCRSI